MSAILNSLWRPDLARVSKTIIEGLDAGTMTLSKDMGTVYWAAGSGKTGVVAHLPLVPVSPEELASAQQLLQAVNGAQFTSIAATAAATVVVVAVVIGVTVYLATKIEKVERAVDQVAKIVTQQDQREYLKYLKDYLAEVRTAEEWLSPRTPASEIAKMASMRLDSLALARQQVLGYVRGLRGIAENTERSNPEQYSLAIGFMIDVLDLVPAGLALERELCLAAGMPGLAQTRRDQAAQAFRKELAEFKGWCETQYRKLALGEGGFTDVLAEKRSLLNALFNSVAHDVLLGDRRDNFFAQAATVATATQERQLGAEGQSRTI